MNPSPICNNCGKWIDKGDVWTLFDNDHDQYQFCDDECLGKWLNG